MKPKIIVFTTDTIQRGGKERQLFILTRYLLLKKYIVWIISFKMSSDNYIKEYNIPEDHILVLDPGYKYNSYVKYCHAVQSLHPDIIFSWDLQTSLFNLFLNRRGEYKTINGSIQHGIRLFRFSHLVRSLICWLSPFVVANSFAGLKANNLRPGKRRFVLYNGIETKFQNLLTKKEIEELRNRLIPGYHERPAFIYISIANFVPYKDYLTVLKALKKLITHFEFYYFVIGDGPMRDKIKEGILKFGLEKNVLLIGKTENVNKYLFASDIMIHSSRGEGISNAILEGMYAGLPIIATNVGGIPETVYSQSSMLFTYKNHKALFDCLVNASETFKNIDPQSSGYKNHMEKFSVESMVKRFEEILDDILKKNNFYNNAS